jgi:hypothetical protein
MSDQPTFFTELKRRNVLHAGAFYAASAQPAHANSGAAHE